MANCHGPTFQRAEASPERTAWIKGMQLRPKAVKPKKAVDHVARREAHARAMLKRAETKLKRAQTIARKWRTKVRYYERKAANKEVKK